MHRLVRYASEDDYKSILMIDWLSAAQYEPDTDLYITDACVWDDLALQEFNEKEHTNIYVIEEDDEVKGYSAWEVEETAYVVHNMSIHPDHRRIGLATTLLGAIANRAIKSSDKKLLYAYIHETDKDSFEFYKHFGFSSRLRTNYYVCGRDAIEFKLLLDKNLLVNSEV